MLEYNGFCKDSIDKHKETLVSIEMILLKRQVKGKDNNKKIKTKMRKEILDEWNVSNRPGRVQYYWIENMQNIATSPDLIERVRKEWEDDQRLKTRTSKRTTPDGWRRVTAMVEDTLSQRRNARREREPGEVSRTSSGECVLR